MQKFLSLIDFFENINTISHREWIYADIDIWNKNPKNCPLYYITDDYINNLDDDEIYINDDELEMPISTKNLNLSNFMIVSDIFHIYIKNNNKIDDTIKEINHYRQFDDFLS